MTAFDRAWSLVKEKKNDDIAEYLDFLSLSREADKPFLDEIEGLDRYQEALGGFFDQEPRVQSREEYEMEQRRERHRSEFGDSDVDVRNSVSKVMALLQDYDDPLLYGVGEHMFEHGAYPSREDVIELIDSLKMLISSTFPEQMRRMRAYMASGDYFDLQRVPNEYSSEPEYWVKRMISDIPKIEGLIAELANYCRGDSE